MDILSWQRTVACTLHVGPGFPSPELMHSSSRISVPVHMTLFRKEEPGVEPKLVDGTVPALYSSSGHKLIYSG